MGECSNRFLQGGSALAGTKANQVFPGPSALGIYHNYTSALAPNLTSPTNLCSRRRTGAILDPDNLYQRHFQPVLAKARVRKIRHDLRHSFGSLLIQSGASIVYVKTAGIIFLGLFVVSIVANWITGSGPSTSEKQGAAPSSRPTVDPVKFRIYRQELGFPVVVVVARDASDDQVKASFGCSGKRSGSEDSRNWG